MGLLPQSFGNFERVNVESLPPDNFIAGLMQLPMVPTAEGYCELVADFQPNRPRLCEPEMVRIARLSSTDKARLGRNKF